MQEHLRRFNGDVHTKEALVAFIRDFIDSEALKRVYAKEDVAAVSDARKLIDGAFEALENEYGIKQPTKPEGNPSR